MDIFRPQLPGHALRHRAQAEFGAGERGIAIAAAQARRRPGEEDRAFAPRDHLACGFPACEEPRIARHLPHFAEHALRRIKQRSIHVAADIEDADLKRGDLVRFLQEGGDILFLAGVE